MRRSGSVRRAVEGQGHEDEVPMRRDEAAAYLKVHPDTLYRWSVMEGRIAYSRLGDGGRAALRFLRADLDDFMKTHRVATVEEVGMDVKL